VRIVVAEGGLYLDGVAGDAPPAQGANTFLAVRQYDVAIGADGTGSADVLLSDADGASGTTTGWNYIAAAELDEGAVFNGVTHFGSASGSFLLRYESDALPLV
jgi:hypothetical protein